MTSIMIRVRPEDFDAWRAIHNECEPLRRQYGMTDGPFYRDSTDPGVALVQLDVEDLERAMTWFASDAFRAASRRAALPEREFWIAEKRG